MTALARWRRMKEDEEKGPTIRRPARTEDCTDARLADKWRREIIMDIAKKIAQIQNPGLGEFKIRDVNDEINKGLRLKYQWELRIKELGGQDHKRTAPRMLDREGREVPGNRGYKYFGAAKDLPGVRELFEKAPPEPSKKIRSELMRDVDADYYGYMDDDDGVLIPLEKIEEAKAIAKAVDEWKERKASQMETDQSAHSRRSSDDEDDDDEDIYKVDEDEIDEETGEKLIEYDEQGQPKYIAHVPVPTQKDIEQALLKRKKMELMEKFASETLQQQSNEAKTLMGYDTTEKDTSLNMDQT